MPINFKKDRIALLKLLRNGKSNAIGAIKLAQTLGYSTTGNQVQLRELIKYCIETCNDLIGANTGKPAGFFIITNTQELEFYLDSLENRTRSENDRRTALINNWNSHNKTTRTTKKSLTIK